MENEKIKEKLRFLEDELEQLKETVSPKSKTNRLVSGFRRINQWFSSYQALLTFTVAMLMILYIQMTFGLDPLESYRSTFTTRQLSKFYQELGDKLIYNSEYEEAERAYKSALTLEPNNSRAIYGLAKAQIFTPSEGQKYIDEETVNIKLDYLISRFPEDSDLYLLKCMNYESMNDDAAKTWCEKAIKLNDRLYAAYIELGYICQKGFDFDCAVNNYKKALESNPQSHITNHNLGSCELLQLNLQDAAEHLELANSISAHLETKLSLGEVYRYLGKTSEAINLHKYSVELASEKEVDKDYLVGGNWIVCYLPDHKGDSETIKIYDFAYSIENKRAIIYYALAIDYALQGDFIAASREFENGRKNDKANKYGDHFVNRSLSATRILNVNPTAKSWFKKYSKKVCSDKEVYRCGMIDNLYR